MKKLHSDAQIAKEAAPKNVRVDPSIPILYFGDLPKFLNSPLRIVTVGLNPSDAEFPNGSLKRFPSASASPPSIPKALNEYFSQDPYKKWFNSLEPILTGFDASYYGNTLNTAIHTDLLSPIATNPTWSKLSKCDQMSLKANGLKIWHDLIRTIEPHIILVSVAHQHLESINFSGLKNIKTIFTFPEKHLFPIKHTLLDITQTHKADFLFARAAQKPFGFFKNSEKLNFGNSLKSSCKMIHWK